MWRYDPRRISWKGGAGRGATRELVHEAWPNHNSVRGFGEHRVLHDGNRMRRFGISLVVLLAFLIGIAAGGYVFSDTQRRPVIEAERCRRGCLDPTELAGLLASVGVQHSPVLPGTVLETDRTLVIEHPRPHARIHFVVIPKQDIRNIADLTAADAGYLADAFAAIGTLVRRHQLDRYQVITNGPGYQRVSYLHFHLTAP